MLTTQLKDEGITLTDANGTYAGIIRPQYEDREGGQHFRGYRFDPVGRLIEYPIRKNRQAAEYDALAHHIG